MPPLSVSTYWLVLAVPTVLAKNTLLKDFWVLATWIRTLDRLSLSLGRARYPVLVAEMVRLFLLPILA